MKFPLIPTIIVALAMAAMVGLGIWQIQRLHEKQAMLARFDAAMHADPVAFPATPDTRLLYRRAIGFCTEPVSWRNVAGENRQGNSGWQHIAACRTGGAEGPGMQVALAWSSDFEPPQHWRGGEVSGVIGPDPDYQIRLVADAAPQGFEPVALPDPANIPNNHLLYAIQWFAFALIAGLIYILALRRR